MSEVSKVFAAALCQWLKVGGKKHQRSDKCADYRDTPP